VQVIVTIPMGDAVKLVAKGLNTSRVYEPILTPDQLSALETTPETEPFDGDAQRFRLPPFARRAVLGLDDFLHDALPGACGHERVAGHQIGPGDLEIERRLLVGLVPRMKKSNGLSLVPRFQAFLFLVLAIFQKEDSALLPELR
jgi:hypothetical protein